MNCRNCEYFIPTYQDKGICTEHDSYVSENETCEDWEEVEE